jgi:hypothetical protein
MEEPAAVGGVRCVVMIGCQNQPLLLLETTTPDHHQDDSDPAERRLRFSYIAHCALDALEEKVLLARRSAADAAPAPGGGGVGVGAGAAGAGAYLGLLYPTERYRVYGYCSATHFKVVLVVEPVDRRGGGGGGAAAPEGPPPHTPSSSWPRDADLSALCQRLHRVYVDATSNPFFLPGAPLEDDPRVKAGVGAALAEFASGGGGSSWAAA